MKNCFSQKHPFLYQCALALWLGILLLGFSTLYYFSPLKPIGFGSLLRRIALAYGILLLAAALFGWSRKKSLLPPALAKGLLIAGSAVLLLCVLIYSGLILWGLQVKTTQDVKMETDFYGNKDVLIVVPHQDDEINLMGGIIEQYTGHNSRVSVLFSTNGDYFGIAPTRYREAIAVLTELGVEQENIIFLGYGDKWKSQQQNGMTVNHIYNSLNPDAVWTSVNNQTASYGTELHSCYAQRAYTRNGYASDLKSVILERRPQIIYCVDHDEHIEHKALDLLFEEVMGQILAEVSDYQPTVYKGFCYGTAWKNEDDFTEGANIMSTKKPDDLTWAETGTGYNWESRVRIPIEANNLNRILSKNGVYRAFSTYASQEAYYHSSMVLNGDKVFWERRTDSLLYNARFSAGEETVTLWNDFKLKDSHDISQREAPFDGILGAECIEVVLPEPAAMDTIAFYDHPDPEINVLSGYLVFDDGSKIDFGPLNSCGDVTNVSFPQKTTERFSIYVTETEGEGAGFSEIEAFCGTGKESLRPQYLMAVDHNDNFVYDYWLASADSAEFTLYSYPDVGLSWENVEISFQADAACSYGIEDGKLRVTCPEGSKAVITLRLGENVATTFSVENPGKTMLCAMDILRAYNKQFFYSMESLKARAANLLGIYRRESVK